MGVGETHIKAVFLDKSQHNENMIYLLIQPPSMKLPCYFIKKIYSIKKNMH